METGRARLPKASSLNLFTSSEVELMETRKTRIVHFGSAALFTSSEVELMETRVSMCAELQIPSFLLLRKLN